MEEKRAGNKMGTEPVPALLLKMGVPMILSMVLQALYNIVDSYFVSNMKDTDQIAHMGEYGVNALTLAFPVQMFMIAVGVGTGVGVNALLSRSLGEGDKKRVNLIAGNAIFLGFCICVVFLLFGFFGVKPYMASQTSDPVVLSMGTSYLSICMVLSFGCNLYMIFEKLLQATGMTTLSMIAQIAGALVNIILDPILIFGAFGLPALGIEGAAYATVIGQTVALLLGAAFHFLLDRDVEAGFSYLKPRKGIIVEIYKVGIPAILMQAFMSFMTYGVNLIFGAVSAAAVTAYGIYFKIQQFVYFAAFGMNNAMIPLIGFNYGRKDAARVNSSIRFGMIYNLIIMLCGIVLLQVFAAPLTGVFALAPETEKLCIGALRIITLGYLFAGANIVYQGVFQALGHGVHSLIVSLLRQIAVALPLAWLFVKLSGGGLFMFAAFPIAEAAAFFVAAVMMQRIRKRELNTAARKED